jgi:hypothetical protein
VVDLPVRPLAVLAAIGHKAAPSASEDSDAIMAQDSEAVSAGLDVRVGSLLFGGSCEWVHFFALSPRKGKLIKTRTTAVQGGLVPSKTNFD